MKTYTLKLKTTSTTNYNLYDGATLVSDTDLAALFATAGEAYFVFDFNSLTPTNTTSLTILNSQDTAVVTNTGLSDIAEDRNFKGTWDANATAFTTFELLKGVTMDEAQLGALAGMIKNAGGIKTLTTADYDYHTSGSVHDGVALWRLPDGLYSAGAGVKAYPNAGGSPFIGSPIIGVRTSIFLTGSKDIFWAGAAVVNGDAGLAGKASVRISDGSPEQTGKQYNRGGSSYQILTRDSIIDTLISDTEAINYNAYYRHAPLSAYQGKVLNDNIGTLSSLTTTDKTSIVAAINELVARVAALEGN